MQSAYFSYPRDFVGTARQARCRLVVRAHADFRATLGKAPGADQTSPEFTQFRRSGAASEVRSRLRFEVTSRSHLAERRIVFWAFCAAARLALDLPFPLVPLAFYRSPAHFCALRCSLDCPPPSPCDPAAPARLVDSAKFFSLRSPPRLLALRFVPRFWRAAQRNKKEWAYENIPGENKTISWRMRSESSSGKGRVDKLEVLAFSRTVRSRACATLAEIVTFAKNVRAFVQRIWRSAAAYVRVLLTCFCYFGPRRERASFLKQPLACCLFRFNRRFFGFFYVSRIFRLAARMRMYITWE